jgi:hypothetical protein
VEAAIALPLSLFVMLGLMQMSLAYNARTLLDYGAFRAARTGSADMCSCIGMTTAALAAVVPVTGQGRTYTAKDWIATYGRIRTNQHPRAPGLPVVTVAYRITDQRKPFDDLAAGPTEKIRVRLYYFYELSIPFVNWVIARYFLGQFQAGVWKDFVDPVHPTSQVSEQQLVLQGASADFNLAVLQSYFEQGIYVIPLSSSWSMKAFSQCKSTSTVCPQWGEP